MRWVGVLASGLSRQVKHAALDDSVTTDCKADELDAPVLDEEEEDEEEDEEEEVGNVIVLRGAVLLCDGPKAASIAALACSEAGAQRSPLKGKAIVILHGGVLEAQQRKTVGNKARRNKNSTEKRVGRGTVRANAHTGLAPAGWSCKSAGKNSNENGRGDYCNYFWAKSISV